MTHAEKTAYARGYYRGRDRSQWPDHMPPLPPDPIVVELMAALAELRDACDGLAATFEPDDEIMRQFDGPIERADNARAAVTKWLKAGGAA